MPLDFSQPTINGRVAIGEKHQEKGYPVKLDYFIFTHPIDIKTGKCARHVEMTKCAKEKYGTDKPKEVEVVLVDHHPDDVFFTSYMNYPGKTCNCKGDGCKAIRIDSEGNKTEVKCDYDNCQFRLFKSTKGIINTCKPTGILTFLMPEAPVAGGVWKFTTHSKMSIGKIYESLNNLYQFRGTLFGLKVKMKIKTVPITVNKQQQNVHTVEVEAPASYDAVAQGAGTTVGTLLAAKEQYARLGGMPVRKELSMSNTSTIDGNDENSVMDAQVIDPEFVEPPPPNSSFNPSDDEFMM